MACGMYILRLDIYIYTYERYRSEKTTYRMSHTTRPHIYLFYSFFDRIGLNIRKLLCYKHLYNIIL